MHLALVLLVAIPIGVSLFDDDVALVEQPFEHEANVEFVVVRFLSADGNVLEIAEDGDVENFFVAGGV